MRVRNILPEVPRREGMRGDRGGRGGGKGGKGVGGRGMSSDGYNGDSSSSGDTSRPVGDSLASDHPRLVHWQRYQHGGDSVAVVRDSVIRAGTGGDARISPLSDSQRVTTHLTGTGSSDSSSSISSSISGIGSIGDNRIEAYSSSSSVGDHPQYYNNHHSSYHRRVSADSFLGAATNTNSIRSVDNNSGGSSGISIRINRDSSSNQTLSSGFLSLLNNGRGASSVYADNGEGGGDGGSSISSRGGGNVANSDSSSTSSLGEHLGVDRLIVNHDHHNYDTGGILGESIIPLDYDNPGNPHDPFLFGDGGYNVYGNASLSDIDAFSEQFINRIEFKMADDLTRYVFPAIIVLGNISNFVAFLVLRRKKFKNSSVAFYMRAYALANLCFLDLIMGITWLCFILDIQYLANRTDWSCRLLTFISNVITYSGIWLVVVMGIDRIVFVNLPYKASSYCTVFTAKGVTLFVIVCLIVVSIHAMWTYELLSHGCWVSHHQDDLHKLTWPWWSAALYSYIPLLLLLIQIIVQSISFCIRAFLNQPHSPPNARQIGEQDTLVKPVFIITVAFFLFTIPSTAINLLDIHLPSSLLRVDVIAKIELTKKITELLSSFNHSLLGIVMLALSPFFQTELVGLVTCVFCCKRSRTLKVFEMRNISQSEDNNSSPHTQADYELCNNNDDNTATDV